RGVSVLNINDMANALKPVFLPGESLRVTIVKAGEEPGQGVGYLEDGTMVVVEGARDMVSQEVTLSVTSVLQTSAGRMIFGRIEGQGNGPRRRTRPGGGHDDPPSREEPQA
ncbi:MAG TPA: PIN domain nuclease, partial [Phycisphaerae bacterium]|nr:PIN domain nuclease [Phycisphaerae bacterium]